MGNDGSVCFMEFPSLFADGWDVRISIYRDLGDSVWRIAVYVVASSVWVVVRLARSRIYVTSIQAYSILARNGIFESSGVVQARRITSRL